LNGTLAEVSIKDDEVAVSGNNGAGGNSNVSEYDAVTVCDQSKRFAPVKDGEEIDERCSY
jgi:hypothetical protein